MYRLGSKISGRIMKTKCSRLVGIILFSLVFLFVVDISGMFRHFQEKSFVREFSYPLEVPNFIDIVDTFRLGENVVIPPINNLYSTIQISSESTENCSKDHHYALLILVKTAPSNFKQRQTIRETWKVSAGELNSKVVFFIGLPQTEDKEQKKKLVTSLTDESSLHKDVVQLKFDDSYYNNTIKTMLEIRWAAEMCSNFDHTLLVDDDYFVSVKNLFKFVENPFEYADIYTKVRSNKVEKLYAGYRMFPPPHRHKIMTKWFVPLEEYPYDYFPPYITAGAILLSKSALLDIHYASFYTAHFRFDDIYVAICAKKMNITPIGSEFFRFWTTRDESPSEYLIASHGFSDSEKLYRFWKVQKLNGFC